MNHNIQTGFTLIAVLVLSSLASILVLTSLKDNIVQERLSGNFQKKVNAELMTERGIYDSINTLQTALANNQTATAAEIIALVGQNQDSAANAFNTNYQVVLTGTTDTITLASTGKRYSDALARLNINLRIAGSGGSSSFSNAVVGCEGVDLSGSGQIDSYDASVADYDSLTPGSDANVSTINASSNITLGGHSPIFGDVKSTGSITLSGSSPVHGSLHATGNITLGQSNVKGNILTGGNYYQAGGSVDGYVRANGSAAMAWGAHILNLNYSTSNQLDIMYGVNDINTNFPAGYHEDQTGMHYSSSSFNINPNVPNVIQHDPGSSDIQNADTNCDNLLIADEVSTINNAGIALPSLAVKSNIDYDLTPVEGTFTRLNGTTNTSTNLTPTLNSSFLNAKNTSLYRLSSFTLNGDGDMEISGGDIIMYVAGDFTIDGDTTMTIAAGSSLTLVIEGKVALTHGAKIDVKQHGLTASGLPAMSIFSSYDGADGVVLSGDFKVYAAIYAPLTDFKVSNSGELYGAVRAKTIAVPGNARIHYDSSLANTTENANGAGSKKWVLDSWQY